MGLHVFHPKEIHSTAQYRTRVNVHLEGFDKAQKPMSRYQYRLNAINNVCFAMRLKVPKYARLHSRWTRANSSTDKNR